MMSIPVLKIVGRTLPEVWERSVIACWEEGAAIRTEYDKEADPPSRDCTMMMVVREPWGEPRIHRGFPGGLDDLEIYRQELVYGVHDEKWTKETYTYSDRLFKYRTDEGRIIDQIAYVVDKLAEAPYTRRAQAVTWKAWEDPGIDDAPCVQRAWFRVFGDVLICNLHIRSNDAYKAAFMNMFAFTDLQRMVGERVSAKLGREVKAGQYVHIADSYHIYGSYFGEFEGFLKTVKERTFEERTWTSEFAEPFFEEGRRRLEREREGEA